VPRLEQDRNLECGDGLDERESHTSDLGGNSDLRFSLLVVGIPEDGAEYLDLMHFHFVTEIRSVLETMSAQGFPGLVASSTAAYASSRLDAPLSLIPSSLSFELSV